MTQNMENLAETLAKSGLACSPGEAMRMAESIVGTENKVAKKFDEKNQEIDNNLTRKRTYKEEIDYLIEKTSMEKKDFHIPIKGYTKEINKKPEEVIEPREPQPAVPEPKLKAEEIQEPSSIQKIEENDLPIIEEESMPESIVEEKPLLAKEIREQPNKVRTIPNELYDDERTLKEIMAEDAKQIYSNKLSKEPVQEQNRQQEPIKENEDVTPEYTLVNLQSRGDIITNQPEEKEDDFIVNEESVAQHPVSRLEVESDQVQSNQPKQIFKEVKEEKKAAEPPKNPIDDVDLMDYFKFS